MSLHTQRRWAVSKTLRHDERIEVRSEPLGVMVALVESAEEAHIVAAAPELFDAVEELLAVSRDVWRAMVDHNGPPVLAGKSDVAFAFIAAGNKAAAALLKAKGRS